MKKHQKHSNVVSPSFGYYGRNEIGILGTPCGSIKELAFLLVQSLSGKHKIGYIDADHKGADMEGINELSALHYGASKEYIDKINFHRFDSTQPLDEFQLKQHFSTQDLVIINGNHFKSRSQIIVIDSKKPLEKKLDKLTNVELILMQKDESEIPVFIKNHLPNISSIPVYDLENTNKIIDFVNEKMNKSIAPVKGLVLAGGRSLRMNADKGKIKYHGVEQRIFMYNLLKDLSIKPHISIRPDQSNELPDEINVIEDTFIGLGPYGAMLSAFQKDPNAAWLITACDQPLLTANTLKQLILKRDPSKLATAFYNPETDFPEPLITLWEPKAYPQLLYSLSLGYSCPRKVLINSDIQQIILDDATVLKNANTPEEYEVLRGML